jgi:pyruvate dehydrogenase E1 component beta subunit
MRPVAEIMYMDFMYIAGDLITNFAAKIRFMTSGAVTVPLVVRTQQGASAGPQHSQCLEMMFVNIPGLIVVLPSTPYDAKGLLKSAIREDNPVIFIEHKALYHRLKGPVPEEEYLLPLGKADVKREGSDVTVVALSRNVTNALEAAERLEKEGVSVEIVDPRTVKPLDEETILNSVRKTGKLVVVHEAHKTGGFGAEVAAVVSEQALDSLKAPIKRVAALDTPIPFGKLDEFVLPNVEDIVEAVLQVVE